ncbi:hypothetical protein [Bacillus sp. JJ722]|uniref:hypothetical protein n=1 Tax=Bacillus sp. JJ722 TaxID=3122973 RepID=UPI002FFE8E2E
MGHYTQITGAVSELTAAKALMEGLNYEVSFPIVKEVYDLLARDPANSEIYRIQVKTLHIRPDRNDALVVFARKGNGQPYSPSECDFIVAVDGNRAFMFECEGKGEYWATEASASKRWIELTA